MYTVYDGNRIASMGAWNGEGFKTYDEAVEYAHSWLGVYSPGIDILHAMLEDGKEYTYYTGCTVSIHFTGVVND